MGEGNNVLNSEELGLNPEGGNLDSEGGGLKSKDSLEGYRDSLKKMLSIVNDVEICIKRIIGNVGFNDFLKSLSKEGSIEDKKYCMKVKKDQKGKVGSIDIELSKDITYEECVKLYEKLYNVVIGNLDSFDENELETMFNKKFLKSSYADFKTLLEFLYSTNVEGGQLDHEITLTDKNDNNFKCKMDVLEDRFLEGKIATISISGKEYKKLLKEILEFSNISKEELEKLKEINNMSEKKLEDGIIDLLKEKGYNKLKTLLEGNAKVSLPENESNLAFYHEIKIYDLTLNIWEDGFGKNTICDVLLPNRKDIYSLRKILFLLQKLFPDS